MALELESKIMDEIGLGNHYNWYNGSGSCRPIRVQAVSKLRDAIKSHHDAGEEIASPNNRLIAFARKVAGSSLDSNYMLTKAWEVCSYVIASHIHGYNDKSELNDTLKLLENSARYKAKDNFIATGLGF